MFVAHAHTIVPAPGDVVWRHFTTGASLSRWFADSRNLEPGGPFRLSFGDGDFFTGRVTGWDPPRALTLSWRFMGVGPTFEVRIELTPEDAGTGVAVTDSGAISRADADALRDGWHDFLSRLAAFTASGRRTRFLWSETIAAGVVLRRAVNRPGDLVDSAWLRRSFGGAEIDARETGDGLRLTFRDPAWQGLTTSARLQTTSLPDAVHLGVTHGGWPALGEGCRLRQRRRYAGLWRRALVRLEFAHP